MTPIAGAMLLIGLAIGGLICIPFMFAFLKKAEEDIIYYHKWASNFADITDRQYKNLENFVDKRFEIIDGYMNGLADICSRMAEDDKKHMNEILDLVRQDHNIKGKQIENLRSMFVEHVKVNDERWNLICDYITNDGPEVEDENLDDFLGPVYQIGE